MNLKNLLLESKYDVIFKIFNFEHNFDIPNNSDEKIKIAALRNYLKKFIGTDHLHFSIGWKSSHPDVTISGGTLQDKKIIEKAFNDLFKEKIKDDITQVEKNVKTFKSLIKGKNISVEDTEYSFILDKFIDIFKNVNISNIHYVDGTDYFKYRDKISDKLWAGAKNFTYDVTIKFIGGYSINVRILDIKDLSRDNKEYLINGIWRIKNGIDKRIEELQK